ncbi:MAG: translation initiation factor IF-3 [Deltaproteobacteria bacterium]|nr:translation initiation factor IF-3 [Deltaproteobacteria bacterium]
MIKAREVRLIDAEGGQLGVLPIHQAQAIADAAGLDLVEVSPTAKPPVCKIMDYGKYKYQQTKKLQEAKKKAATFTVKEIKVRPKTGDHDLETKITHIKRFLTEDRDKVKVTVMFRGREIAFSERGMQMLLKVQKAIEEMAVIEQAPRFEGRTLVMILAPK